MKKGSINKHGKERYRYDFVMNSDDYHILCSLRDDYAINVSRCFKIFLKNHLEKLKRGNVNFNT